MPDRKRYDVTDARRLTSRSSATAKKNRRKGHAFVVLLNTAKVREMNTSLALFSDDHATVSAGRQSTCNASVPAKRHVAY